MGASEKTAIAAHLYVTLRRVANRVIDIEWMAQNEEYARAIIKLAVEQGNEELARQALRYQALLDGELSIQAEAVAPAGDNVKKRYIGTLR
jgi:phage shock protein A